MSDDKKMDVFETEKTFKESIEDTIVSFMVEDGMHPEEVIEELEKQLESLKNPHGIKEELKLKVYIGEENTFAFVTMFKDETLKEAAEVVWSDGCLDFDNMRGLYEVTFKVESGFEAPDEGAIALEFDEFTKIEEKE